MSYIVIECPMNVLLTVIFRLHSANNETVNWLEQTAMKLAKRNEFDEYGVIDSLLGDG